MEQAQRYREISVGIHLEHAIKARIYIAKEQDDKVNDDELPRGEVGNIELTSFMIDQTLIMLLLEMVCCKRLGVHII